ncbi:claudin-4-like [Heterodontus francisci]|uniref:claudin-4-like n=1 Tax=Heterodontus francisci TaxID=7792 RepID=UPI00355BC9E1
MASTALQLLGFFIGIVGWIMACGTIGMPQWKVTPFIGNTIVTSEMVWEGIWMNCIYQGTGYIQCKMYESQLALPPDIQLARALMCMSIVSGISAITLSSVGMKCTKCSWEDERFQAKITVIGGIFFTLAGLCVLIPVSWTANSIIVDFYNPQVPVFLKRELGNALFLGWGAACILVIGGGLLCCSWPQRKEYRRDHQRSQMSGQTMSQSKPPVRGFTMKEYV